MATIVSAPPPPSGATDTRSAVARGLGIGLAAISVVVGAWFGYSAWRDSNSTVATIAAPVADDPADTAGTRLDPHDRARAQIAADRIAQPAGDNAAETFLDILRDNPADSGARQALVEILPLVNDVANAAAEAGQVEELARLIALIEQADAVHAQLPRLRQRQADLVAAADRLAAAAAEQREALGRQEAEARPAVAAVMPDSATAATAAPATAATALLTPARPVTTAPTPTPTSAAPPASADGRLATATPPPVAASAASSAAAPVARRDIVVDPVLLRRVEPRYPPQALARRLEGFVEVELTISAGGQTTDVRVVRAEPNTPLFTREALRVARDWRYQPKTIDGVPAQSTVRQRLNFRMPRG